VTGTGEPRGPGPPGSGDAAGLDPDEIAEEVMAGFRRTGGGVSARFTAAQAGIVRMLVGQVAELVGGPGAGSEPAPHAGGERGGGGADPAGLGPDDPAAGIDPFAPDELAAMFGQDATAQPPDDPVLARLLPDAYTGDPEAAGDFRRYTEQGLRSGKVAAARTVLSTLPGGGGRVRLSAEDGEAWLRALNDVRLALGVRLGITEDHDRELAPGGEADPRSAYLQVYDWLTYLQETLVHALL